MENRLELNKRPVYELPDEVLIEEYLKRLDIKRCKTPNFEPDIVIESKYDIKVSSKYKTKNQIWIKSNNKDLINFIKTYNFNTSKSISGNNNLSVTMLKKIILEEFYGGEIWHKKAD